MSVALPEPLALLYRGIAPNDLGADATPTERRSAVTAEMLERHIDTLGELRRKVVAPRFYVRRATEALPEGGDVLLTFDGGYASHYEVVFPLLKKRKIRAAFFVPTARVGEEGRLDWGQLREMATYGMVIGAYGNTGVPFTGLDITHQRLEFEFSSSALSSRVEMAARLFAFPGGRFFRGSPGMAREYNFEYTFAGVPVEADHSEGVWVLGRLEVRGDWDAAALAGVLARQDLVFARERRREKWRRLFEGLLGASLYAKVSEWYCGLRER